MAVPQTARNRSTQRARALIDIEKVSKTYVTASSGSVHALPRKPAEGGLYGEVHAGCLPAGSRRLGLQFLLQAG